MENEIDTIGIDEKEQLKAKLVERTQQLEDIINAYINLLNSTKNIVQTNEILINKIIKEAQKG